MYYEVLRTSTTTTTAVAACALCTRRPLLLSCRRHAPGLRRRHAEAGLEYNRDQLVPWLQPQPYYSSCEAVMGLLFSLCRTTYCSSSSLLFRPSPQPSCLKAFYSWKCRRESISQLLRMYEKKQSSFELRYSTTTYCTLHSPIVFSRKKGRVGAVGVGG